MALLRRVRTRAPTLIRVERHALGPRFFVVGRRLHECHAGAALLVLALATGVGDAPLALTLGLIGPGAWLAVKDWRDFFPSLRDTTAWRAGVHRRPRPLRAPRRGRWLAPLSGLLASVAGILNVASALTPDLGSRARLVQAVVPRELPMLAHAFALSGGVALIVLGFYLARRRRRAWGAAVLTLIAVGALNILKGLDVEEALASWCLATLLCWGRPAFYVEQTPASWSTSARRVLLVGGTGLAAALLTLVAGAHWGSADLTLSSAFAQITAPLRLTAGPIHYRDPFDWVPAGIALLELGVLLTTAFVLFRPLAVPLHLPAPRIRARAREIVAAHGRDTLSFFKLRGDQAYFFESHGRAFVAYTIEGGVLLVSGDPVGPEDALPRLLRELCAFAEVRGLRLGVLGASESFAALASGAGLRALYIGDEAIIEAGCFSLEGRGIRKVRQSVARLEKAGYTAGVVRVGELDEGTLAALEQVSERWRSGVAERGFSMAMDGLRGEHLEDSMVVIARDGDGLPRGFLHFVPTAGPAVSLSQMRRDRDAPNGLMEFLVVRAVQLLGAGGVRELSLNFAAFARLLHSPRGRGALLLGKLLTAGDRWFQTESLYRFNAKFGPSWRPRYLLYEGALGIPRAGLAAMWAEGQLPKPRLPTTPRAPTGT